MGKIILRLDRMMADRKISLNELSEKGQNSSLVHELLQKMSE